MPIAQYSPGLDPVWVYAAALLLALLFGHAGLVKWRAQTWFKAVVADYELLPRTLVPAAARLLPALEMAVALLLLLPASRLVGATAAAGLAAIYAVAMAVNLRRGRRGVDCGCGGRDSVQLLSWWLVARNAVLLLVCLVAAQAPVPPVPEPAGWLSVLGLVAGGLLLFSVVTELAAGLARLEEYV